MLKFFNTNELIISTISVVLTLYALYFLVRRSKYSLVFYLFCDVTLILLWGIYVFQGNIELVPIFLNSIMIHMVFIIGEKLKNFKKREETNFCILL